MYDVFIISKKEVEFVTHLWRQKKEHIKGNTR